MKKQGNKFRICLIGCGIMANDGHGPALLRYANENANVVLAGCCDVDGEKAEAFRSRFGFVHAYTDYRDMLSQEEPDGVTLVTPTHLTASIAMDVMRWGYPVLMEKPPARDLDEMKLLLETARKTGMPNRVCFNRRFAPLTKKFLELRKQDSSPVQCITGQMYRVGRTAPDFETTAIHLVDTALFLTDSPCSSADFVYRSLPQYGPGVVNMHISCQFQNGAVAQLTVLPLCGVIAERITLSGDGYTYYVEYPFYETPDRPGRLQKYVKNQLTDQISGNELAPSGEMYEECGFYEETRSFYDSLREGKDVTGDVTTCIQSVILEESIRKRLHHVDF